MSENGQTGGGVFIRLVFLRLFPGIVLLFFCRQGRCRRLGKNQCGEAEPV